MGETKFQTFVAAIGAVVAVGTAALSHYLTKGEEREDSLQQGKQKHYEELLGAISDWGDAMFALVKKNMSP